MEENETPTPPVALLAPDEALAAGPVADAHRWWQPRTTPKHLLPIVGPLTVFGPLCVDMYLPALPRISRDLHASASATQLSLTTCLIGIAVGQITFGPIIDRYGRRRPLFFGITLFALASLACAFAPNIYVLVACRTLQGLGGAAGIVTSRAVVRDRYSGIKAARFFSTLMTATALGPIIAPQLGAEVLRITSWRGIFVTLFIAGIIQIFIAATRLPETLALENRISGGLAQSRRAMCLVLRDRKFLANAIACGLAFGAIFSYVSGSSFVLEDVYHLSPQRYSLLFALNGLGMLCTSQVNARIVHRFGPTRMITFGLAWLTGGGTLLLIAIGPGHLGLWGVIPGQCLVVMSNGFVMPNATSLALQDFPHAAGSASALLGSFQFGVGAFAAPLVGIAGSNTAYPMILSILAFGVAALLVRLVLIRPGLEDHAFGLSPEPGG